MATAAEQRENAWEAAAAAAYKGRGINLRSVDLNDQSLMNEVYQFC